MTAAQLESQFLALSSQIGMDGAAQWQVLHRAYTSSGLAYHNLTHIADCLQKFFVHESEAHDPIAVELTIWFHDAIYDPRESDNEEQSAQLASDFLIDTPFAAPVHQLIIATKHSLKLSTQDEKLICDIDLSILGASPADYQRYAAAIRSEYAWVPEADYQSGRSKVLQSFLDRPAIFALPSLRALYETQARQNIQGELQALSLSLP